jgi:clathrin heavy chain
LINNRPDEGQNLQTKLFEINLMSAPNVAENIFQMNKLTHYARETIARLCEQAGLYSRALQNYITIQDAKRAMLNTHVIPKELLITYFGRLNEDDSLQCMCDLHKSNRQNVLLVAEIAVKYASNINSKKSIEVLESLAQMRVF